MGLMNGDRIISIDNQEIEKFYQIIPDIVLNERKTIQIERDGRLLEVKIPKEVIPALIKGKGRIDARIPFSPLIVEGFPKESQGEEAGLQTGDEILRLNNMTFEYYDEFKKSLGENIEAEIILQVRRNDENLDIPLTVNSQGWGGFFICSLSIDSSIIPDIFT
ncbi:hypothetical protein ES703_93219 [subsurface metagenome]